jgi:hypothetical protein
MTQGELLLEEGLQSDGLQLGASCAAAADLAGVDCLSTAAALEASVSEIEFGYGIAAATNEEWTPTSGAAKAGANPAQWHDL